MLNTTGTRYLAIKTGTLIVFENNSEKSVPIAVKIADKMKKITNSCRSGSKK